MEAFESLVAMLLSREHYWTKTSFKVSLKKEAKSKLGNPTTPRREIDVLAYKAATNELLVVECKSFLDSTGVIFRNGNFVPPTTYKLFTDASLFDAVKTQLCEDLTKVGLCRPRPTIKLCLVAGKIAGGMVRKALQEHFDRQGWVLKDETWITKGLESLPNDSYENNIASVVAKFLLRDKKRKAATRHDE